MNKTFPYSRTSAMVDAGNAIDWEHPDNRGLVYLMGGYAGTHAAGGIVQNLVTRINAPMVMKGAGVWANGVPGHGAVRCVGAGAGADVTLPSTLYTPLPITIACSFQSLGTPDASAAIFGTTPNNTNATPFCSAQITNANTGGFVQFAFNTAGSFGQVNSTQATASLTRPSRIAVVYTTASISIYINGALNTQSVSARSNPTYTATAQLAVGNFTGVSRNLNGLVWGGRIQNFAADARWVERDYRASLAPITDGRLRWMSTRSYYVAPGGTNRRRRIITGGGR